MDAATCARWRTREGPNGPTPSECSLLFAQTVALIRYDGLDQFRKLRERFLPSEIAHFERNWFRNAFLNDVQLSAARNATESDGGFHLARQMRVVEPFRIANELVRHQLLVRATE